MRTILLVGLRSKTLESYNKDLSFARKIHSDYFRLVTGVEFRAESPAVIALHTTFEGTLLSPAGAGAAGCGEAAVAPPPASVNLNPR